MSDALTSQYSFLDRLLHRMAFSHPAVQRVLGQVETDMFKARLAATRTERPVFVTGLPRAGTTLVLELLYGTGCFASFTYRHMPFVLNPLLWHRLSAGARREAVSQQRAHGDNMTISYDSPEAFEEVLWINHLRQQLFDGNTINPLRADDLDAEFREAFRLLTRKLVCASQPDPRKAGNNSQSIDPGTGSAGESPAAAPAFTAPPLRYLSKNNANLSRLDAIASVFEDAELICVFRHPDSHVRSLHRQHLRFSALHDDDRFARDYMAWIGHHDFGANFRPIRFGSPIQASTDTEAFWLRYWIDAYRYVLEHAPAKTLLLCYETLLDQGAHTLGALGSAVGLGDTASLQNAAGRLRAPGSSPAPLDSVPPALAAEAEAVYNELQARSTLSQTPRQSQVAIHAPG